MIAIVQKVHCELWPISVKNITNLETKLVSDKVKTQNFAVKCNSMLEIV